MARQTKPSISNATPNPSIPPTPSVTPPSGVKWPARAIGALIAVVALAGAVWGVQAASVTYRYTRFGATAETSAQGEFLSRYVVALEEFLREDPSNGMIRNRYATVLAKQQNYGEAIRQFDLARQTSNAQNGKFFLANMYEKLQNYDRARELMAEAVILNPTQPEFYDAHLRQLNNRMDALNKALKKDPALKEQVAVAKKEFATAARAWFVRAPYDSNSYLFMGQFYVEPLFALQSYRCYLIGLSRAPYLWSQNDVPIMILPKDAMGTVKQILDGKHAAAYKGLP